MSYEFYFIPGLVSDAGVFKDWNLGGTYPTFIELPVPRRGDTLAIYAKRLCDQIVGDGIPFIIGTSFGGILAIEMARHLPRVKVAIISSVKHPSELPPYFRVFKFVPLQRVFPITLLKRIIQSGRAVSNRLDKGEQEAFEATLGRIDNRYIRWALDQVPRWELPEELPIEVVHFHGTEDKLFPHRFVKNCILIEGGKHFMAVDRQEEIADRLLEYTT